MRALSGLAGLIRRAADVQGSLDGLRRLRLSRRTTLRVDVRDDAERDRAHYTHGSENGISHRVVPFVLQRNQSAVYSSVWLAHAA